MATRIAHLLGGLEYAGAIKFYDLARTTLGVKSNRTGWPLPTALPYTRAVRTIAETPFFIKYAAEVWADSERVAFVNWIAVNPDAGDVIPGSGGCRKVRWSKSGSGKRGGARVIYFLEQEHTVWLLIVYKKAKYDNLPTEFVSELRKGVEDAL
ncbi:MAG: hypothetical protein O9256_00940 [Rhizobiaceae bacterium]|nr:hypothetical protein [Rhizobiaceae bacterium]